MKKLSLLSFCALFIMLFTQTTNAQGIKVGGGFIYGTDIEELGLQVNGVIDLPVTNLRAAADIGFFFVEDIGDIDSNFWTFNANAHYLFDAIPSATVYGLAGLNFATASVSGDLTIPGVGTTSFDDSSTEVGLNVGGGAEFGLGPVDAFTELKYVLGDASQVVFTAGVRLGIGK